ncbi:MAG TPA: hypothetical protein VH933_06965 [Aestuariivirgaceae bacterium]|jgi:hypothetical protein
MLKVLPPKIVAEICALVESAKKAQVLVQVYVEAEKIRQANIAANVALEDIADEIIVQSASGPGYEANLEDARSAVLGEGIRKPFAVH